MNLISYQYMYAKESANTLPQVFSCITLTYTIEVLSVMRWTCVYPFLCLSLCVFLGQRRQWCFSSLRIWQIQKAPALWRLTFQLPPSVLTNFAFHWCRLQSGACSLGDFIFQRCGFPSHTHTGPELMGMYSRWRHVMSPMGKIIRCVVLLTDDWFQWLRNKWRVWFSCRNVFSAWGNYWQIYQQCRTMTWSLYM